MCTRIGLSVGYIEASMKGACGMVTGQELRVHWVKCQQGRWCDFSTVNLANVTTEGVYVIWQTSGQVIYIGQGNIADRLNSHRNDRRITQYGPLLVTWAQVSTEFERAGAENYLASLLNPIVGQHSPMPKVSVNLPE